MASTPKSLPKREDLIDYKNAVAGHAGTLCDRNGVLFIKPCMQHEIDFYETAQENHPEFADIMPLYMGSLMLNEVAATASDSEGVKATNDVDKAEGIQQDEDKGEPLMSSAQPVAKPGAESDKADVLSPEISSTRSSPFEGVDVEGTDLCIYSAPPSPKPFQDVKVASEPKSTPTPPVVDNETWVPRGSMNILTDRAVVLENATYGYEKPNILDVKLGQRLWADDAPRQKRVRLDAVRAETTHDKLGFRIAGMRVFKGSKDATELDEDQYKTYDKDYGRYSVNNENVVDAFRKFIFNTEAGIDEDIGCAVAKAFKTDLERVCRVMEKERTRMFSASLLFVFEGDGEALRRAIAKQTELGEAATKVMEDASAAASSSGQLRAETVEELRAREHARSPREADKSDDKPSDRSTSRTDSGIALDDEFEGHANVGTVPTSFVHVTAEDIEGDSDDDDFDAEMEVPPILGLRLIDFAHARFVSEEEGPDENNLLGVRSLIQIFDELSK